MSSQSNGQQTGSLWELSLYEAQHKPHEVVTDTSVLRISPRALHSELMCPICLDLMKNAQTTKECLHRFCQECIITALRSGNKECPTCRKKLISKRSLRADPNFDALIAKIYPNREELYQHQEKHQRTDNITQSMHFLTHRKRRGVTPQDASLASSDSHSPSPNEKIPKLSEDETDPSDTSGGSREEDESHLEFQLRPHPLDKSVSSLEIRNLATSSDATVAHLIKFLDLVRTSKEDSESALQKFTISTENKESSMNYVALSDGISLRQISDNYWTPGEKLMLYFSCMTAEGTTTQ